MAARAGWWETHTVTPDKNLLRTGSLTGLVLLISTATAVRLYSCRTFRWWSSAARKVSRSSAASGSAHRSSAPDLGGTSAEADSAVVVGTVGAGMLAAASGGAEVRADDGMGAPGRGAAELQLNAASHSSHSSRKALTSPTVWQPQQAASLLTRLRGAPHMRP